MTIFTLLVVLVATTASALTMTLAYTMTKRLVASETKQLRRQLHQAQLKLRYRTERHQRDLESALTIARHAIRARDYFKTFAPSSAMGTFDQDGKYIPSAVAAMKRRENNL